MPQSRFLVYQPSHGLGVELFLLETAFAIAGVLERILVIPLLPDLETTRFRRGLEHYFTLDSTHHWISTPEFLGKYSPVIDLTFQVIPEYRAEYRSSTVRALHPVWTDNIEHLTALTRMGFAPKRVVVTSIRRSMTLAEIATVFASTEPVIALSFLNGITDDIPSFEDSPFDDNVKHVPYKIQERYVDMARSFVKAEHVAALHWRRRHHIKTMAALMQGATLPSAKKMIQHVPASAVQVIVASDARINGLRRCAAGKELRQFHHSDPQVNAVVDMALCINAEWFIGTHASTFSFYIAYARSAGGIPRNKTVLL